ncbi:MAG: hypothetical protein FJ086_07470 [Deltaproteobacteria bacterium]|nr:hypothetical protein [Deltaproteobacteria bacterium]
MAFTVINSPSRAAAMAEAVDLDPQLRADIFDFDAALEGMNLFAVLGARNGAAPDEVKSAHEERSKRFNLDAFQGKNLGNFRPKLDRIVRKLAEAERTLTQPELREKYKAQNPALFPACDPREAERRARMARHPYLMKKAKAADHVSAAKKALAEGRAAVAFTEVQIAIQVDGPNAELAKIESDAKALQDRQRAKAEISRAEAAEKAGDLPAALSAWKSASAADPKHARSAFRAALLSVQLNEDPKISRALAQKAVELNPRDAEAHLVLGKALKAGGSEVLADKAFAEVLKLRPDHPELAAKKKKLLPFWPF